MTALLSFANVKSLVVGLSVLCAVLIVGICVLLTLLIKSVIHDKKMMEKDVYERKTEDKTLDLRISNDTADTSDTKTAGNAYNDLISSAETDSDEGEAENPITSEESV